jgi:hypothetical protein
MSRVVSTGLGGGGLVPGPASEVCRQWSFTDQPPGGIVCGFD